MTEQVYVNRGEMMCKEGDPLPSVSSLIKARIFWMGKNLVPRLSSAISKNAVPIFLAGFFSVASYLLYLLSLSQLPLSQVIVLFNTNVVLTAILGALILSEKGNWQQKLAGAVLAFAGAALVAG